jgi:hypothetical protein
MASFWHQWISAPWLVVLLLIVCLQYGRGCYPLVLVVNSTNRRNDTVISIDKSENRGTRVTLCSIWECYLLTFYLLLVETSKSILFVGIYVRSGYIFHYNGQYSKLSEKYGPATFFWI